MGIPEQGQTMAVRQRRYAVVVVLTSALRPDPLHGVPSNTPQHLVSLTLIEDEALGENLQVIRKLELGTRVQEKVGLPERIGFDLPRRLDSFLDPVQWRAVSSADVRALQAPFRAGVEIEDYQLDTLVALYSCRVPICSSQVTLGWARRLKPGSLSKNRSFAIVPAL